MNLIFRFPKFLKAIYQTFDFSSVERVLDFPERLWLFYQVRGYTMVTIPRLKNLYKLAKEVNAFGVEGDLVECGVYNGGSAAVMAYASYGSKIPRKIWLFDSFQGLPPPTEEDGTKALKKYHKGWCEGDMLKVKEIFTKFKIPPQKIRIVKGWFKDTFPKVKISKIAILHIDADFYNSVKLCLEKFYDNIEQGGFIVFDDYYHWEGAKKAMDEFGIKKELKIKFIKVDSAVYFQKSKIKIRN